jgi:maltooligosyltrehalose synthase
VSPYFKAKKRSLHGYDLLNHNELNPEIGSVKEYDEWMEELARYGMGQVLDIVPNHMSIVEDGNRWWMDVLENGPSSPYDGYFDIDWKPVKHELENKVLLPVLGGQYGRVLEDQELELFFEEGAFFIRYYDPTGRFVSWAWKSFGRNWATLTRSSRSFSASSLLWIIFRPGRRRTLKELRRDVGRKK